MFVTVIALKYALLEILWSCGHFLKLTDSILFEQRDKSLPFNSTHDVVLYPQNGDRIVTIDSVTLLHRIYNVSRSLRHAGVLVAAPTCRYSSSSWRATRLSSTGSSSSTCSAPCRRASLIRCFHSRCPRTTTVCRALAPPAAAYAIPIWLMYH